MLCGHLNRNSNTNSRNRPYGGGGLPAGVVNTGLSTSYEDKILHFIHCYSNYFGYICSVRDKQPLLPQLTMCPFDITYHNVYADSKAAPNYRLDHFYYSEIIPSVNFGKKAYMLRGGKLIAIIPIACVYAEHRTSRGISRDWLLRANIAGEGIKDFFPDFWREKFFRSLEDYDAYMSTNGKCGEARWFETGDKTPNQRIDRVLSFEEKLVESGCWDRALVRYLAPKGDMQAHEVKPRFTLWCDSDGFHCDIDDTYEWGGKKELLYTYAEDALSHARVSTIVEFGDFEPKATEQTIEFNLNITCTAKVKNEVIDLLKANGVLIANLS